MAACAHAPRWRLLFKGALLLVMGGAIVEDASSPTPSGRLPLPRNHSHYAEANNGKHPYVPKPMVDPFSDVNCKTEACTGALSCTAFPSRLCQRYANCPNKVCLHKNLFPMLKEDLLLFVVMFLIAVCAGAAGIGGGGLNVPILMMVSSFGIKEAVPLSHAAVMGNAFAQLLINAPQRHPSAPSRPLIHYELAILALPAQLGGNSLGVVVGRIFPPTLLVILSLLMLGLAASKTLLKGIDVFKAFKQRRAIIEPAQNISLPWVLPQIAGADQQFSAAARSSSPKPVSEDLGLPTVHVGSFECVRTWSGTNLVVPHSGASHHSLPIVPASRHPNPFAPQNGAEVQDDLQLSMRIPWIVIATMVGFNLVFCIDFLGLSPDWPFRVTLCSTPYWAFLLGLYPFAIASIWIGIRSLKALAAYHTNRGDPPIPGDPEVTLKLVILFPLAAVLIGLVAGLVGLGGGEFMVPLLLEFGLQPRVATATSGFLILFATSSNIVHYLVASIMQPFIQYGAAVFILAFFGALTGLTIRDTKFLRENNYLLVFLLTGLLFVSAALLAYRSFGMQSALGSQAVSSAMQWGVKPFCNSSAGG